MLMISQVVLVIEDCYYPMKCIYSQSESIVISVLYPCRKPLCLLSSKLYLVYI